MPDFGPLVAAIRDRADRSAPFVMAIDGPSGAGKSTLAAELAQMLGASVLEGDDFYAGGTGIVPGPPAHLAEVCIDWRRLRATLATLRLGREARFAPFDWVAFDGRLGDMRVVPYRPIILLEGVYSARAELRDLVDMTVLVECPEAERMARLTLREGEISEWERQWHRAEAWYFANSMPPAAFDLRVTPDATLRNI